MKINKIFLASIFMLVILTFGVVCATDDANNLTATDSGDIPIDSPSDDVEVEEDVLANSSELGLSEDNDVEIIVENIPDEITANSDFNLDVGFSKLDTEGQVQLYIDEELYDFTGLGGGPFAHFIVNIPEMGTHTICIKYLEGNHNPCELSFNVTVLGYVIKVRPIDPPFIYGEESYDLMVYMLDGMNGDLSLIINGKTYNLQYYKDEKIYSDRVSIDACDLKYGENIVTVVYSGDKGTNVKYKATRFNTTVGYVGKIDIPYYMVYNENVNITLILPDDANGALVVNYDGENKSSRIIDGKAVVTIVPTDIGQILVEAQYVSDDGKYPVEDVITYSYSKPKFSYDKYASSANGTTIQFEVPARYEGNVEVYRINYENFNYDLFVNSSAIVNGKASVPIKLPDGEYDLQFRYDVGEFNDAINDNYICFLSVNPNIDFNFTVKNIFKTSYQNLLEFDYCPSYDPMDFLLTVDGVETKFWIDWEYGYIDASNLDEGMHTFNLTYLGNSYFNPASRSGSFNVSIIYVEIPQEVDMELGMDIKVNCPDDISGKFTVKVDGKKVNVVNAFSGEGTIYVYEGFEVSGIHDVEVIYVGNYGNITKKAKVNSTYYVSVSKAIDYGLDDLIIYGPISIIKKLDIIIDGVNRNKEIITGLDCFYIPMTKDFKLGNHTVLIRYKGDKIYPAKTFNQTFEIVPAVKYASMINKGDGVSLIIPDDAKGNLVVFISERFGKKDNMSVFANVSAKGNVFIPLDNLTFGNYYIAFNYTGDDYNVYCPEIDLIRVCPHYNVPKSMIWKSDAVISIDLPLVDLNWRDIYLEVDEGSGTFYTKKDIVTGKETISLSKLPAGENSLYVRLNYHHLDDEGYDIYEYYDSCFDVNVVNPIVAKDFEMVYGSGAIYKATIIDKNGKVQSGKKVTFYIDGKKVKTVITNSKGIAALKITKTPKTYKIKTEYNKLSVTKTLKVHYVTLKSATVKKSAKSLILVASLCKINGKYLKGKVVTFKFNGKTYKAKTDYKGIAKVTVAKSVLSKLKVGSKVAYQATYLKDTVKKTAVVKK